MTDTARNGSPPRWREGIVARAPQGRYSVHFNRGRGVKVRRATPRESAMGPDGESQWGWGVGSEQGVICIKSFAAAPRSRMSTVAPCRQVGAAPSNLEGPPVVG